MTLANPTILSAASSSADSATYNTASLTAATGSRVLMLVVSGKSANLAESPTGVSHASAGALTKVNSQAIPNTNLVLSAWTGVGNGVAGAYTITHTGVMDNCCWTVGTWTSDNGTPSIRRSVTTSSAAGGTEQTLFPTACLATSAIVGALGYNSGSANVPNPATGFSAYGSRQSQTAPTVQLMGEYVNQNPPQGIDYTTPVASGRAQMAIEVADATAAPATGPTVTVDGITGTASLWDGSAEVSVTSLEFA